jgi:hypothetical protein
MCWVDGTELKHRLIRATCVCGIHAIAAFDISNIDSHAVYQMHVSQLWWSVELVNVYFSVDRFSPHVISSAFGHSDSWFLLWHDTLMIRYLLWPHPRGPAFCMSFAMFRLLACLMLELSADLLREQWHSHECWDCVGRILGMKPEQPFWTSTDLIIQVMPSLSPLTNLNAGFRMYEIDSAVSFFRPQFHRGLTMSWIDFRHPRCIHVSSIMGMDGLWLTLFQTLQLCQQCERVPSVGQSDSGWPVVLPGVQYSRCIRGEHHLGRKRPPQRNMVAPCYRTFVSFLFPWADYNDDFITEMLIDPALVLVRSTTMNMTIDWLS